jgi:hypothetical protein
MKNVKKTKSKMVRIRADRLKIHPKVQRDLSPLKVKKIANDLDLDMLGTIHAVEEAINGVHGVWVIDGQHRIQALLDAECGEWVLDVKVFYEVDLARASHLFLGLNDRLLVPAFAKFVQELQARNPDAVGIYKICTQLYGLKIRKHSGTGVLNCVNALKRIYSADQGKSLNKVLDVTMTAWGQKPSALEGKLLEGLGIVYSQYDGLIDREVMVKKLAKYPGGPAGVLGDAKGLSEIRRTTLARCVAETSQQQTRTTVR